MLNVLSIVSVPFEENSYIAYLSDRSDCIVFDPGLEPGKIFAELENRKLTPAAILCTHGHSDHIAGNAAMKQRSPEVPLVIGAGDEPKLSDPVANLSAGFGIELISPPADRTVREGDVIEYAGIRLKVLETPGHSSGHVVFAAEDAAPTHLFSGDVLFAGSVGRTDFPGCSFSVLKQSIDEKLFPYADDTIVLPGHGPTTTIGAEKQTNPFVGQNAPPYAE